MRRAEILAGAALLFTVVIAVLLIILVIEGRSATHSRDQGLRTFICYFEHAVPASHRATVFFNGILAKLHDKPCS